MVQGQGRDCQREWLDGGCICAERGEQDIHARLGVLFVKEALQLASYGVHIVSCWINCEDLPKIGRLGCILGVC